MAEWRKVFADGKISKSELDFLQELKSNAKTSVQKLDDLIKDCEKAQGT